MNKYNLLKKGKNLAGGIVLVMLATIICVPVLLVLSGSIKSNQELQYALGPIAGLRDDKMHWSLFPNYPTLMHYIKILFTTPQFFVVFWNSVKLVVTILIGQVLIAVPAAWAFARFPFRFRKALFTLYIILMMLPFQVTMLSSYLVLDRLQLLNTHSAVILPAVFSTFPVFLIYRGFRDIPNGLLEAARLDGASEMVLFIRIGLPLGSSGIMAAVVLGFLEYWNLLEQPLAFLKDKVLWPLSLYLPEITLAKAGLSFATSVITLIPAIFVFIAGQDYLEKGIVASALKE